MTTNEKLRKKKDLEIQELLHNADQSRTDGILIDEQEDSILIKDEIKDLLDTQIDDPAMKYDSYYKCIEAIFREYIPKGEGGELIREEKCTFLTGHRKDSNGIRGADSRQSTLADMSELLVILHDWIDRGANPFDLYTTLLDENKKRGYGEPT